MKSFMVGSLIDSIENSETESLFFYIARPTGWTEGNEVNQPDTVSADNDSRRQIIAIKAIRPSDVNFLIPKNPWTRGTLYQEFSDDLGISGATFHTMTDEFNVYKVISNNNGAASTYRPSSTNTSGTFSTKDGYVWKYMYTIPESIRRHITDDFVPVETVSVRGLDDVTQRQFDVRSNAFAGGIEHIDIPIGSSRYLNVASNSGMANTQIGDPSTNVLDTGSLAGQANVILPSTDPNSGDVGDYLFYDFVVLTGVGAGQREKIVSTNAGTRTITLENTLTRPLQSGDIYQIVPGVVISGDGVSASAFLDFSPYDKSLPTGKIVRGCRIVDPGKNYSYANVSITGPSTYTGITLDAQMSPLGGHGFDAVRELGSSILSIMVTFSESEGGVTGLNTTNDVLEYGIIRNPILNDDDAQYLDSDGNPVRIADSVENAVRDMKIESAQASELSQNLFTANNYIIGKNSKATAQIVDYLPSNETGYGILRLSSVNGKFVEPYAFGFTGETIAEFSQLNDVWSYTHTDRARVVSIQSASERTQTSLLYDCTYQLGVSGDASGLNETTFTRDGVVTGSSGGFGTVLDFKPNQAGTGGVLILTNVFGAVNDGFTLEEAIGMSAGPRQAVINTVTKPQIYLKSGEILFSQSISPVARGPEKMEEYQLLIGF